MENMSTENPTVTIVGHDQGTFNFVQSIAAWEGQGPAPFTTTQVQEVGGSSPDKRRKKVLDQVM